MSNIKDLFPKTIKGKSIEYHLRGSRWMGDSNESSDYDYYYQYNNFGWRLKLDYTGWELVRDMRSLDEDPGIYGDTNTVLIHSKTIDGKVYQIIACEYLETKLKCWDVAKLIGVDKHRRSNSRLWDILNELCVELAYVPNGTGRFILKEDSVWSFRARLRMWIIKLAMKL